MQDTVQDADCSNTSLNGYYWNGTWWQIAEKWFGVNSYSNPNWSYDSSVVAFQPQCYYIVKSSAVDAAGNGESSFGSRRFKFTPPPAETRITLPSNLLYYKNLTTVIGTANADTKELSLEIKRLSDNYYWDFAGSSWTVNQISTGPIVPSAGNWNYDANLPQFITMSSYTLLSVGVNFSNVTEDSPVLVQIHFDTDTPKSEVVVPDGTNLYYNSMSKISGTAAEVTPTPPSAGVNKVWVQLKAANGNFAGKFWDNETSTFTASWNQPGNSGNYYVAGSSWEYTISYPTAAFINGVQYEARTKASDLTYNNGALEGNESGLSTVKVFNFDISAPTATITAVQSGQARSAVDIASGTILETMVLANAALPPGEQINTVKIHVKDNLLNQYWDGSSWGPSSSVSTNSVVYQSSWSVSALPNWADEGIYTMWAEALDKAGNSQTVFSGNGSSATFTIDKSAPVLALTSINTDDKISSLSSVSGTANDPNWATNSGIAGASNIQVQISYLDGGDTYYYDNASQFSSSTLNDTNSWWPATNWTAQGPSSGTWTYAPAGLSSAMISDKSYRIRARAQDDAIPVPNPADLFANAALKYNIVYDTTPPSVLITYPLDAAKFNNAPQIAGTADAYLAGLSDVRLNVSSYTQGGWSLVSSDNQADNIWSSSWSWTTLGGLIDQTTYQVVAKVQDKAGNWSVVYSTVTFVYDTTPPDIYVAKPVNNRYYGENSSQVGYYLDSLSGTASDSFGIDKTEVQIYDVVYSSYWHQAGWVVGVSSWHYAGQNDWTFSAPPFDDGHRYRLEVKTLDVAGNLSPYTTYYFYYDRSQPQAGISKPGSTGWYNEVNQIEGTASDPSTGDFPSGMYHAYIAIQKNPPTGLWWDGSDFASGSEVWLEDSGNTWPDWYLTGSSTPTWATNTKYKVKAQAMDVSRNTSTIVAQEFVYDTQIPTMTITAPENAIIYYSSMSYVKGTSQDVNSLGGIDKAELRIKNLSNNQYWDWPAQNYVQSDSELAWFVAGTTNTYADWFSTGTPPGAPDGIVFNSGISYEVNLRVFDKAGNYTIVYTTRNFTYDVHKPTGAIVNLAGNAISNFPSAVNPISGTANDMPQANNAGLETLTNGGGQIRIYDVANGLWWNYVNGDFDISNGENAWIKANSGTSGSWGYDDANLEGKLTSGNQYLFQYRGKDKSSPANIGPSSDGLDDSFTVGKDSVTVTYDKIPPFSRILAPENGSKINSILFISGTAADSISGISAMGQIEISICEISPNDSCWNGVVPGTFSLSSEQFFALDGATLNGSYDGLNWSMDAPDFQDGYTYVMKVRARDNALPSNIETNISSNTFVYDTTPPNAAITYPISLPDSGGNLSRLNIYVTGTAYEPFGIKSASVSYQEGDTLLYYDVSASTFDSVTQKWITGSVAGTGPNYTWTVSTVPLQDNRNYNIQVIASDMAGNVMTPPSPTVIRYDVSPPVSGSDYPPDGSYLNNLAYVSGTAQDVNSNPSGLKGTQIKIQRISNSDYWNGAIWTSQEIWLNGVSGSPWTKNTQLPPSDNLSGFVDGESYMVQSRAYDVAGNTQSVILSGNTFVFDVSSPTARVLLPEDGTRHNTLTGVDGTANDVFNVKFPEIRIYDIQLARYWKEGSGWVDSSDPAYPEIWNVASDSSSVGGEFAWTYDTSAISWPDRDEGLRVEVKAKDEAGNYLIDTSTFSFDQTPPDSAITYPPSDGQTYSSMTAISGTSLDLTSNISNVRIRMWYLSDETTYYWSPAAPHWGNIDSGWWDVAGSAGPGGVENPWSYANTDFTNPGTINFAWKEGTHDKLNGKTFYIAVKAVDATTNEEVSYSTRTFIFDNEPPLSAPVEPGPDTAYNSLAVLSGTSVDGVSPVANVYLSILSEDETGGPKYFDGSNFASDTEFWLSVTNLYPSSWSYTSGFLSFSDKMHYVVKSSATDAIGNVQDVVGSSRFLYDETEPQSSVVSPVNGQVYNDNKVILGNASDPGFTSGIDGTGSGVYPSLVWHQGKVEVLVFRDTEPTLGSGPILYGSWDDSGYFWDGSTWTPVSAGEKWVQAQYTDAFGNWQYAGLVCVSTSIPCWVRGDSYSVWVRAADNAGNLQTSVINSGPKFYISAPAQSFALSVSADPMTAGDDITLTVEAKDGLNGAGNTASAYQGTVRFYIDGVPGGPEYMDNDGVLDDIHGLPQETQFLSSDYGIKSFQIRLRKAAARTLRVEDKDTPSIYGTRNVNVDPTTPDRIQVIADYDPLGEMPAPGKMEPFGEEGREGAPRTKPAGSNITFLLQVTDKYWNLVVSSAADVYVCDSDPNNDTIDPDGNVVFVGSTTIMKTFVSADPTGWSVSASGQGLYTNASNPSSNVPVISQAADRLLILMPGETRVQGKFDVEPKGKSGSPSDQLAGSSFTVTVYGVDPYYNTDPTASFSVSAEIPTDSYDVTPASQTLESGATDFAFTPVVASTHIIKAESGSLPAATSVYYTPNPVKVWWSNPVKLHILAEGQHLEPGKPPYDSNPATGGRVGPAMNLTAGVTTQIMINLVGKFFNVVAGTTPFMSVSSNTPVVQLNFPNDPNIQVRGLVPEPYQKSLIDGSTVFSFIPVTRNQSSGMTLEVVDTGATGTSFSTDTLSGIIVDPNSPVALQVLIPGESGGGESPAEGTISGKTGSPGPLIAGTTYTIKVRSVDKYWNLAPDGRQVRLEANDVYAQIPSPQSLASGEADIYGFIPSAATGNLVIDGVDNDTITPELSSQTVNGITVVPGSPEKMIFVLPGQYTVPGKVTPPYGVDGVISTQTAGNTFDAEVYATDGRYNIVTGVDKDNIKVVSDDPFVSDVGFFNMTGGSATVSGIILRTAQTTVLTAQDFSGTSPTLEDGISGNLPVEPNNPTNLRVLVPGESREPGSTGDGRTDPPDVQQAGVPFDVTVDITDSFWNLTPGASQEVRLVADDPYAVITPSTQTVVSSATFTVLPKRAGSLYLRAEMVNSPPSWGPTLAQDTSTIVNVNPGVPRRLLLILPGENFDQGSPTGKSGVPSVRTAGTSFGVRVGVVDDYFNLVPGRAADVQVNTPTDLYADPVSTAAINTSLGYTDLMYVTMKTATTHYLSATDFGGSGLSDDPQSSTFTVVPDDPVGLQILMPGESALPGSGNYPGGGKIVNIDTQTAGTQFMVTVNLVDKYMNKYTALSIGPTVYVYTSDIYDIDSSTVALTFGSAEIALNMVTKADSVYVKVFPVDSADNYVCTGNQPSQVCRNDDAAARSDFKVYASTATQLAVFLEGETLVEGKCDVSPPCKPGITNPGRSGSANSYVVDSGALYANVYLVDKFYNKATENTGAAQDTNPAAVMPEVKIILAQDSKTSPPPNQTLVNGFAQFSIDAKTSLSTYTVVASTSSSSSASYDSGVSTAVVYPAAVDHLDYVLTSTTVIAGEAFSADLIAYDTYDNVCSSGPNIYLGTVTFVVQDWPNPNQDPQLLDASTAYLLSDAGVKTLTNWFTFRKAGINTLGAEDYYNSTINVSPLVDVKVLPGPPKVFKVDPHDDGDVSAGSNANPGRLVFTAQLTDAYDNNISSAGFSAYLEIAEVSGSTGTFEYQSGSTWYDMGTSTIVVTDSSGTIGVECPLSYRVSSKAGDWARFWVGTTTINLLTDYIARKQNVSGILTTIGGTPTNLVFVSSQPAATVGIQEIPAAGAYFTVERRDDFDNPTKEGNTDVYLMLPSDQISVHTDLGRSLGTVGNSDDYGFRNVLNDQFLSAITIYTGQTQASFRYHDRVASYSGVSPSSNTAEGGRPGYWQIEARSGSMQPAIHQLQVDPYEIAKVSFANPQRSMTAGKVTNAITGDLQSFKIELRDMFDNPSVTTDTVDVALSTHTRMPSKRNNSFGFSLSSAMSGAFPPIFSSTITYLTISLDDYAATFYYLDTMASSMYEVPADTKPIIEASVPSRPSWAASTQAVVVESDITNSIGISQGAGMVLMAGVTSQMFVMSLEDKYGNATPVKTNLEDSPGAGILFDVVSTSLGDVKISSYTDQSLFVDLPAQLKLSLGEATTSFYIIDTLVSKPTHQLEIDENISRNWSKAISSYVVLPAEPDHISFETPSRRLVAGTTVQYADYALEITTNTNITIVLKDAYENTTTTSSIVKVRFSADRNSTYGGLSPDEEVSESNPNWKVLKTNPVAVDILPGNSNANLYIWDTLTDPAADPLKGKLTLVLGTATISASATIEDNGQVLPTIYQEEYITPSKAFYFTLHHTRTLENPLPVRDQGNITLVARDQYGNMATGDSVNGQYYLGKINMATNSSGGADLRDANSGTTDYTFIESDAGQRILRLEDNFVEILKISVTDYYNPNIYGYTNDSGRGLPKGSAGDVVISGLVMIPTDLAPQEEGDPPALYRGDGLNENSPAPVPMLRMSMQTSPSGAPSAYLQSIQVRSSGTLNYSDIAEIAFYADNLEAGVQGLFDGETKLGEDAIDIFISSGVYDTDAQSWFFNDLNIKGSTNALITNIPHYFFLAVRVSSQAVTPRTFGIEVTNPSFIVLDSTFVGVAYNNFPLHSSTSAVLNQPAQLNIKASDIAAWWQPESQPLGQYSYVSQGEKEIGMLKIDAWTDDFEAKITGFTIIKTGSGSGKDIRHMRIFLDSSGGDPGLGDGVFNSGADIDKEITDPNNPPAGSPDDPEQFILPILNSDIDGIVNKSTRTFFIVYEFEPDATPDLTHGAKLEQNKIAVSGANVKSFPAVHSSTVPILASSDSVHLDDFNKAEPNNFSQPTFVTQNDVNKPVARLTMSVLEPNRSAIWQGLKLDRWITAGENGGAPLYNKASDVKKISIWYDSDEDGLLNVSSDTEVLLIGTQDRKFPIDILISSISAVDSTIEVSDIQKFFPTDSPFPMVPGRLVINDEQTDPDMKEVVYYSTVNIINNTFGGVLRGQEGTIARDWSTGTYISGQAILPLIGEGATLEGQTIYNTPKDYFVTYDIDPLATVNDLSLIHI